MSDFKIKGNLVVEGSGITVAGNQVSTASSTETLTNKTINADNNTISNIANSQIKSGAGIDAAKLADGSVSNAEFQYLNGVTSLIQDQLDDKADITHSHVIGDVTGLQDALDGKVDENAPITGATKTKITYDSKGLVTAGADATTSDISEGSNLYFTDSRAKTAAVVNSVGGFETDQAPSVSSIRTWVNDNYATVIHNHAISDVINLQDALDDKIETSLLGANNGVATLNAGGKLTSSQIPAIAITDTFVVASEVAMLALTVETGDVAVRTDLNKSFILQGTDPTELTDWQELLSPTDQVQSVNGATGTVVLDSDDINEGSSNLYFTSARAKSAAVADAINDGTTDVAPSQNAVFDALANKAEASHTHAIADVTGLQTALDGKVDENAPITGATKTKITYDAKGLVTAGADATTSDIGEGSNLYFTDSRAKTAAVVNSTAGSETDQAPSVSAIKSYITTELSSVPVGSDGDINETSFSLANDQSLSANVTGFAFANATVRSFKALVSVVIDADTDLYEVFELLGVQKGAVWNLAQTSTGDDSQIVFTITNAGQIQYVSPDFAGFNSGTVKFRAITTTV